MDKYKVGTVFELFENDNQEYMILDTFEKENFVYAFVIPINTNKKGVTKTDYTKAILIKINKTTEELKIETDEKIIGQAVENMLDKIE